MISIVSFPGYWRATVFVDAFKTKHRGRRRSTSYFLFFQNTVEGELKPFRVVNSLAEANQAAREFVADGISVLWRGDQVPWSQRPTAPWTKGRKPFKSRQKRHHLKVVRTACEEGGAS